MAEFIALVNDDWSLPFPKTNAIDAEDLRYTYDEDLRTVILYQGGTNGKRVSVSPEHSIRLPEQIISHMGLAPGQRVYYDYSLRLQDSPIKIRNDAACCRCGDYSLVAQRYISSSGDRRGTCRACTVDILLEILTSEDFPDDLETLSDDDLREFECMVDMMCVVDEIEEERNGTLPCLKSPAI